jgi:hypothetical protein
LLFGLSKGQNTFNKYYDPGLGNRSVANEIETLKDSSYLVISPWQNSSSFQGLRLTRIDKNGIAIDDKKIFFDTLYFYVYLNNRLSVKINDFTSIVLGDTYFGNDRGLIFAKVNNHLADTIQTKYYCDHTYAYGLAEEFIKEKNRIWYFGNKFKENDNSYTMRPVFFKIDTSGNFISQVELTSLMNYGAGPTVYDTLTHNIYFVGTNYNLQSQPSVLACLDTSGNVLWNTQLPDGSYFTNIQKFNNYLVASGFKYTRDYGGYSMYKMMLAKFDLSNNGSITWMETYGNDGISTALNSLLINNDESITAAGTFKFPNVSIAMNHDGVILKTNAQGDSLWSRFYNNYGQYTQECFYDIKSTLDGGYIVCGAPNYLPGCQSWVVKTDSMGIAPGATYTSIKENESSDSYFKLWPNPANDYFFIKNNSTRTIRRIEVINEIGQIVISEKIPENGRKLNIENLPSGIYTVKLTEKEGSFETQKLVIVK